MAFVPLTDEEKRILSGEVEEPEEKSPDTGTGGLFGGINVSSIPEVAEAREQIDRESVREPFDTPENPFAIDQSPLSPRASAYKMLEDLPEPAESFQGSERLNMDSLGGGRIVELSPQEKAIAKDSQGYSPSTLFLGKRFREAYSFGDPEAYAEDVKRSMATGIPMHMIDDAETRQAADMRRNWQMNLDGLTKLPPALKNWLSIPGRMEIARDDISTLAQLAEILKVEDYRKNTARVVRGYRAGEAGSEIARIRWGEIVGTATEEDLARLPGLEEQAALNDLSEEKWADRVVGGAGYMAGQRLRQAGGALRGALKYGLGAAGTAAILGQAGPQALLPEEVVTVPAAFLLGSKVGGSLGALKEGLILEAGSALDDYLKITDENGEPLPRDLAKMGALLYGVGAAGLEMLQFNQLTKFVPNIGAMMTKQGVATLLKTPTIRNALMSFAKEYAGDLTFESLTEGVQQLWQLGVGEMMKNKENYRRLTEAMSPAREVLEGGIGAQAAEFSKFRETTWEEIASSVGNEITSAATTFALALVPGSGTSLINNISAANRAKAIQQKFASLGDVLSSSKLAKRFGPAVSEVIGELTKNGPIEEIGINARVFSDTLEQAGEDPAAVAKELGISEEALTEARALDGDVWVPTGTYAEKIAATELHGKIAQDIRLGGPEELTAREAETVLAKQQEDLAAAVEEAEAKIAESGEDLAAVNEVKTSLKEQLDTLGLKWLGTQTSEAYSTLWANMALQASKRWGMTVKEWTDRINLTVEKDDSGAVRVVGKKKSAAGVSVLPGMKTAQAAEGPVKSEGGVRVSLDRLRPSETIDPETLIRAKENMAAAERGEIEKRSPLTVWDRGDGTYSIADGNHTYTALKEAGVADVPVVVEKIQNRNVTDMTSLYAEAAKSEPEFKALMADLQSTLGGELVMRSEMKTEESVNKKVSTPNYAGDFARVVDVLGGTLVFDTEEELLAVAEKLKDDSRIVRIKDRWTEPNPDGYRDYLMNVRLGNGYVGELQLHHRGIAEAKQAIGHNLYKLVDGLKAEGYGEEHIKNIQSISRAIYGNALETGQAIPASLKASDLDTLRDLINHLNADSGESFVSEASGMIMQVLGITSPSSKTSSPDSSLSSTKGASSSVSTKNSNVFTDTTSRIQDGSAEAGASTTIIPDVTERSKGNVSEVVTGSGTVVQTQFRLAEADELVASNTATFSPNERYPAELQPRKRDRAASVAQVEGILSNLDPERLGESRMASDGAPIVGSDMVVESGNGRVLALQLMYGRGKATSAAAKSYRSWLKSNAGRFGLLQEEIEGMKAPVLVRERTSDVDRVNFVKEANVSSVAAMSASETARSDAEKMSEGLLSIFDPSRDILSTENVPFVKEFLSQVVPSSEWGSITTTTGALSKAGVVRMQNALAARAYGDSQLLERMAESEDDNIRNITKALIQAAPALSVMEDRIARGVMRKGYSLSSFISSAVNQMSVLRERGETVNDYLAQQTMFADAEIAPEAKRILAFLDKNKRAPGRISGALAAYARLVENQGDPNQQNLFGEEPLGRMDLWDAAESSAVGTTYEQAVTSTMDIDYLAAVEAGDMETARRMVDEVAQEAGFTVQHVFHGSKRIDRLGNELKPSRATSGPMPFFTDAPDIAENYSKNKADTSLEIPESYTGWFKVNVGRGKPKTIDQAWLYLSLDKRRELATKLPHVVRTDENGGIKEEFRLTDDQYGMTDKGQWEFVLREKRGNVLAAAVDIWLDSGELFDQEEDFLEILRLSGLDGVVYDSPWLEQPGVLEAHLAIRNPFATNFISDDDFAALEAASKGKRGSTNVVDEWDKRRFSGKKWMELLEQDRKDGTSFAWTSIPDWVSRELHRMGYDGIKDQGGKYTLEGHTVWIPFFPWQAKRADSITRDDKGNVIPLSQRFDTGVKDIRYQVKGTGPQGKISFGDGEVLIQLTPKANRSTFLHETGHLFLWDLDNLVKSGKADAETLDHWRTLEGWWKDHSGDLARWIGKSRRFSEEMRARFSGAEGERIVREALEGRGTEADVKAVQISAQEYFARGFEQYAMEGKSPSVELRRIFDLFRKWLTKIYTALKGVPDVELSEEVRQVMDRLVASEEAIELSELKQKSDKAASAMLGKGVDDITAREYRQAAEKAAAEAKSRLLRVLIKEISEDGRKRVEEARRQAEGQILPELLKIPAYRVYDKLVTWLSGTGEKLSTVGLTAEQVMGIPEGMYSDKGGVVLDVAADLLGLESEAELLALLAEAKANPLDDVLKAHVDQAVAGIESSMEDPEVMESLAEEAILGPERMRLLSLEREILARRIRKITGNTNIHDDRTLAAREAAMRQQAKAMILGKSMRESIAIHKFLAEAKRAAKQAFEAAVAGRLEDSLEAKDREMLYSALYLEGKLIREEAEKQQRYLKKFWAGRQRLKPLIGEENLVQIQALLERYGFQKEDQASKKSMSLHDWLKGANAQLGEDLNEQGAGIPVAEWLWEDEYKGRSKGWKELTVTEFRELHEAMKAIEHYGRSRNKLVSQQLEKDLHKWKDLLQQSVLSVFGKLRPGYMDPNDKGAGPIARFLAAHDRVEFLLRRLDGFADLGTAWQLFFKPVADAEAIEIRKMKDAKRSV